MQVDLIGKNGIFEKTTVSEAGDYDRKTKTDVPDKMDGTQIYPANLTRQVTYGKPGKNEPETLEDIQAQAQNLDAVQMKNEMVVGAGKATTESVDEMNTDGFSLTDTDIHTVVTETDKIQMELAKAGKDTHYFTDQLSESKLQEMTGNAALAQSLSQAFQEQSLPLTKENESDSIKALELADSLDKLDAGAVKYMLANQLPPTIINLYQASHSSSMAAVTAADASYDTPSFEAQIGQILKDAGMEPSKENMENAKWLAANELAVTPENLQYTKALQSLEFPLQTEELTRQIAQAVADSDRPQQAYVLPEYSYSEQAKAAETVIREATGEDLAYLISEGQELTIANLRTAHQAPKEIYHAAPDTFLSAQRQLQETRLVMTLEANKKLLMKGMAIDTKPLQELVEALKGQEQDYYKNLLEADGTKATDEQIALFAQVDTVAQELPYLPAVTIGSAQYLDTIASLHETGKALQEKLDQAGERYETMMTAPRADMGDSIQKAFRNVDELLDNFGLEHTPQNQRAVRILAYNGTEVTPQNIDRIKLADAQVQEAFDSLKPAVVREMIKEGINPLEMSLSQLNETARKIESELPGQDELTKFSEYLWKLEQTNSISESERDSYIGIYRLIHQVEAGDGAAIGALVSQGAELSMKNLLSAMRSDKKRMDYSVDDTFAGVNGTLTNSISDQIDSAYQLECFRQVQKIAKEPEQFQDLLQEGDWTKKTPEELLAHLQELEATEAYKQTVEERQEAYFQTQLQEFEQALQAGDQVWSVLNDYRISPTVQNVLALQEMLHTPNQAIKKLMNLETDDTDLMQEIAKIKQDLIEKMGQDLKTPEELAEAQNTLANVAEHCGQTVMYAKGMTTLDLKQLQTMTKQLSMGTPMAGEEHYAIPVLTSDGAGSIHVKIVRGRETKGMVALTMESDTLGHVAAKLQAKESGVQGFVAAESRDGAEALLKQSEALQELLTQALQEQGMGDQVDVPILQGSGLDLASFSPVWEKSQPAENEQAYRVQTGRLYALAEKMVVFFKEALEK